MNNNKTTLGNTSGLLLPGFSVGSTNDGGVKGRVLANDGKGDLKSESAIRVNSDLSV